MGFGNFLRGIAAQVNPWDNGKTYGSYNPPKKRDDQTQGSGFNAAPAPTAAPNQIPLQAQQPQNHFQTGISHISLPGTPSPAVTVNPHITSILPTPTPLPGTVIHPNKPVTPQPVTPPAQAQPGFWGHVGNGLKTAGQTAVGTVANLPEVGLAAARAGSGLVEGVTQLPHVVTALAATGTQKLNNAVDNRFTHALNTGAQTANTGVKTATTFVDKPFDYVNRNIDKAAQGYANNVPAAAGGAQAYRATQIPLNVLAGILTLGAGSAAEGGSAAGEAGNVSRAGNVINKFTDLLNRPLTSNADNVVSRTAQAVSNKTTPVVQALNAPFSTAREGVNNVRNLPIFNRNVPVPAIERAGVDAGEVGNVLSDAQIHDLTKPPTQIPVQQTTPIDVTAPPSEPTPIPVTNNTPQGTPIREVGGDTPGQVHVPTQEEAAAARAKNAFDTQAPGRPDKNIEGVSKPNTSNTGVFTRAEIQQERQALDDALANKEINKTAHKAANKELDSLTAADDAPKGQKINVKSVDSIPVQNKTDIPTNLPETPGKVRVTDQSAPTKAQSEAVANTPVPATPAPLPAETQHILDNPKQYNKAQVKAARNQRKLATQLAKAKEGTAAAAERIDSASPIPTSDEGHVATGQFDTSANGGSYQTASRAAERQQAATESAQMSPADAVQTARANQAEHGSFTRRDIRNIRAMFDAKRIQKGTPEYNEARTILKEDGTISAQSLALRGGNTIRRTASPTELMSHYESKLYRLANDPSKIDSTMFDQVETATTKFTDARDAATQAYNRFTEAPTKENAKAYHAAQDAAEQADKDAKVTEYNVAQKVLKGNKDTAQVRELQKMAQSADLHQMDGIDASMLSGTGTFARNFVNSAIGGGEEGLFGGLASRIAGKITGENIGGGAGRGTMSGFDKGVKNIVDASKARASNAGWNPFEHFKNWSTTGNQLGDSVIESQVTHNVLDHYTQMLKDQGYKGGELTNRASVMARADPDNIGKVYAGYARASAGLGSGISRSSTIETTIKNAISDGLSFGNPNQASEFAAKLLTRMTVGFPTAVGRTITEGAKRATLGVPNALRLFGSAARNDPAVRAQIIKESIKQAGSGATTAAIFYGLGQKGLITGSYPTDPAERAQWQREGITENSIKIDGNYYQLPSYLGSAAIPAVFAATLGRNNGDVAKSAAEVAKSVPAMLPTDQASNVMDWINGKTDSGKFLTQTAASATRAVTPVGALLNQISKSFDSTANDTTTGTALNQFYDKVASGIPGLNNASHIPDKTDDAGNPIHNPGALPLAFGASSTTQDKGVAKTNQINDKTNTDLKSMSDNGAFSDQNIKAVVGNDDKAMKIYSEVTAGKQVTPAELKTLRSAMTKGVPNNGDDTAYLEKGQYDTNLTALNLKRSEMAADPTTKPSDLAKMDLSIKRSHVYKDNNISYDQITAYKNTSLADWRSMGDDTSDKYDPDTYQKLWQMDQLMTQAGASDNTKDPTAGKFSAKQPGKGRGGNGSGVAGGYSAGFGQLKAGSGAPNVQNYQTISQSAASMPTIQTVRPNIVHKVGSSG